MNRSIIKAREICELCHEPKQLINSHIFPEFLYQHIYAGDGKKHRFITISMKPERDIELVQKGIREEILCFDCDQKIARWETYVSNILYGNSDIWVQEQSDRLVMTGLQYRSFKLFQMSLIWRASVATIPEFSATQLGPYEEPLRKMIFDENPGKQTDYPCILLLQPDLLKTLAGVLWPPIRLKKDGHTIYLALAGGFFWFYRDPRVAR
jgi:hypothetical protein